MTPRSPPPEAGGYQLLQELGRGGMGVVYRARHVATGAERALKVLAGSPDPELVARFRREAEALARAAGDGIVPVHEIGVERGRLWFTMGLMPGGSLRERLGVAGRLDWKEAVGIVARMAKALERCHEAGLVHRDLKPENVLFDEEGQPRIADFGCARDATAASLTETGVVIGTPVYMAPEQIEGKKVDGRADVFALGAILHELVTGEKAFLPARTLLELHEARRTAPPPRASARVRGVPAAIDAAIAKALAFDPEARFQSAEELCRALTATSKTPPRGLEVALAVALAGLVVVAGLAAAVVRLGRSPGGAPPAAPPPTPPPRSQPEDPLVSLEQSVASGQPGSIAALESRIDGRGLPELTPEWRGRLGEAARKGTAAAASGAHGMDALDRIAPFFEAARRLADGEVPAPDEAKAIVAEVRSKPAALDAVEELVVHRLSELALFDRTYAVHCIEKAFHVVDLDSTDPLHRDRLKRARDAKRDVERAARILPREAHHDVYLHLAAVRACAGDLDRAFDGLVEHLRGARQEAREKVSNALVTATLNDADLRKKTTTRLREIFAREEKDGDLGDLHYVQARLLAGHLNLEARKDGRIDEFFDEYRRAVPALTGDEEPERLWLLRDTACWVEMSRERFEDAEKALAVRDELPPPEGVLSGLVPAYIHAWFGRYSEALEVCRPKEGKSDVHYADLRRALEKAGPDKEKLRALVRSYLDGGR